MTERIILSRPIDGHVYAYFQRPHGVSENSAITLLGHDGSKEEIEVWVEDGEVKLKTPTFTVNPSEIVVDIVTPDGNDSIVFMEWHTGRRIRI